MTCCAGGSSSSVGLPDQHLDDLVFGQVPGAVEQVLRGEGAVAGQDRLDRLQRPREAAGVSHEPVEQLVGGVAQPEAGRRRRALAARSRRRRTQALVERQLALAGRLDLSSAVGVTRVVTITLTACAGAVQQRAPAPRPAPCSVSVSCSASITDSRLSNSTTTGSPGGKASSTASITCAGVLCGSWYMRCSRCAASAGSSRSRSATRVG